MEVNRLKKTPLSLETPSVKKLSQFADQNRAVKLLKSFRANDRIHHAYLFTGGSAAEKYNLSRSLAAFLNCQQPQEGDLCGHCANCRLMERGTSSGFFEVKVNSDNPKDEGPRQSIGIEQIRALKDTLRYGAPVGLNYQVVVINRAEDLTEPAQNALLKILEEPAPGLVFILLNDNPYVLRDTIRSRCLALNLNESYNFSGLKMTHDFPAPGQIDPVLENIFGLNFNKNISTVLEELGQVVLGFSKNKLSSLLEIARSLDSQRDKTELREQLRTLLGALLVLAREKMKYLYQAQEAPAAQQISRKIKIITQSLADLAAGGNILIGLDYMLLRLGEYVY